jgi:23S rRNA pseudouridine1911/1915/1917 synthase
MTEAGGERHRLQAGEEDAGERVDRFLGRRLPRFSRSRLKALIEAGRLDCDGQVVAAPAQRVKAGQTFAIFIPETAPASIEAQAIALDVVYEDSAIIVIDKPAGMVVHPAPGNPDRTLVNALLAHCGEGLTGIGGTRRPGIVHRLDKDTSGLLVAAKTQAAHAALVAQFAGRTIERVYEAIVWGVPSPREGEISGNIGRSPRNRKKMAVLARGGRPAVTRYRVLKSLAGGAAALVECRLLTGRTHQIRVHMAEKGHPVLGDPLYGRAGGRRRERLPEAARSLVADLKRQALHAKSLAFAHPTRADRLQFTSDLPDELRHLKNSLEVL